MAILTTVEAKAEAEGALRGPAYLLRESSAWRRAAPRATSPPTCGRS
ncbi:hypothetical protein ACFQU2_24500 [Siccirubricoccus deserti]